MASWISKKYAEVKEMNADKRFWVFVLKNPETNDIPKTFKDVDTVTWQLEEGSKAHTPHLQGVVQFLYPKSWSQVRTMAPRAWWHVMLGTVHEAKAYCTKEETRIAGPWSWMPVSQALLDCLAGLSGVLPCTPQPELREHIADPVPPAVAQPPPADTDDPIASADAGLP